MKVFITVLICIFTHVLALAQGDAFNAKLLSNVSFEENSNDIWGFEIEDTKYVVIGTLTKARVFSLKDPKNPVLVYEAPGARSIWRDIKNWGNYVYVTADQGQDGLVIIDMNDIENIKHKYFKPRVFINIDSFSLLRAHNIYIDEKGYAYLAGHNMSRRGVAIFDLNEDPWNPKYVGSADLNYAHDAYVVNDTLYTSEIYIGGFGVYDISDRSNPQLLAIQRTGMQFTHNAWLSDDKKYLFTTDERANAYVEAYNISDLSNIQLIDRFRPLQRENHGVIPHNTHYYKGYLVTSWYTDGLRIMDAHKPDNLVEVAYYDTWEDPNLCHEGFYGCWGAFPFTNSNIIYGSDINNGLFIVEVDYKRACYLEGVIVDENENPINGAKISIVTGQLNRSESNPAGQYKTGIATSGEYEVIVEHPNFITYKTSINLEHGQVTSFNPILKTKKEVPFTFIFKDELGNAVGPIILTLLKNDVVVYNLSVKSDGVLTRTILEDTYDVHVSKYGYLPLTIRDLVIDATGELKLEQTLVKGYGDTFLNNFPWITGESDARTGKWVKVSPIMTLDLNGRVANQGQDSDDIGSRCFVTGGGIPGYKCDALVSGYVQLTSPVINLSNLQNPLLTFQYYVYKEADIEQNEDIVFEVFLRNDDKLVSIFQRDVSTDGWEKVSIPLIIPDSMNMDSIYLEVFAYSAHSSEYKVVECGFDDFLIQKGFSSSVDNLYAHVRLFPNPTNNNITLQGLNSSNVLLQIFDTYGILHHSKVANENSATVDVSQLSQGVYFMKIGQGQTLKFVKI